MKESVRQSPSGSRILLLTLIVAASGVVAISAQGLRLILPPAELSPSWVLGIRILGGLGAIGAVTGILVWSKKVPKEEVGSGDPVAGPLRRAGIVMALLVLGGLLANPLANTGDPLGPGPAPTRHEPPSNANQGEEAPPSSDFHGDRGGMRGSGGGGSGQGSGGTGSVGAGAQPAQSLLRRLANSLPLNVLLVVVAVLLFVLMRRRRRNAGVPLSEYPWGAEEAEAGLVASLAEVSGRGGDPRSQITAAYLRLLHALSEAGAPRKSHEAPHEHLRRTLGSLGVQAQPLHELTRLYVMAQFSERRVTDRHRAKAVQALEVSLASIREYRAAVDPESVALHQAAAPA